jgi:hypothetical protein
MKLKKVLYLLLIDLFDLFFIFLRWGLFSFFLLLHSCLRKYREEVALLVASLYRLQYHNAQKAAINIDLLLIRVVNSKDYQQHSIQ